NTGRRSLVTGAGSGTAAVTGAESVAMATRPGAAVTGHTGNPCSVTECPVECAESSLQQQSAGGYPHGFAGLGECRRHGAGCDPDPQPRRIQSPAQRPAPAERTGGAGRSFIQQSAQFGV